jgi:AcrR family transcriptional regulator
MKNTPEQKEEKRLKLEKAATRAFLKEGYAHTTMNHIAAEAGMTKGNIYCYYASKEELFTSIVKPIFIKIEHLINSGYEKILNSVRFDISPLEHNIDEAAALFHQFRDETVLLFRRNQGSPYENVRGSLTDGLYKQIVSLTEAYAAQKNKKIIKGTMYFRLLAMFWLESFLTAIDFSNTKEGINEVITESVTIVFSSMMNALE